MGRLRGPLALWALVAFSLVLVGTSADSDEVSSSVNPPTSLQLLLISYPSQNALGEVYSTVSFLSFTYL